MPKQYCCDAMEKANESGTDNEAYSSAVREHGGQYTIGLETPPISYCPWCGVGVSRAVEPDKPKRCIGCSDDTEDGCAAPVCEPDSAGDGWERCSRDQCIKAGENGKYRSRFSGCSVGLEGKWSQWLCPKYDYPAVKSGMQYEYRRRTAEKQETDPKTHTDSGQKEQQGVNVEWIETQDIDCDADIYDCITQLQEHSDEQDRRIDRLFNLEQWHDESSKRLGRRITELEMTIKGLLDREGSE